MNTQEEATLPRLLRSIDGCPGFAGLGAAVQLISSLTDSGDGDARQIAAAILRDAALTARLLRLSNASHHARGGRNVSTIDQAIVILGLNTVKTTALSLSLLDALGGSPQVRYLHAEIVAAHFCSLLCVEITRVNGARYSVQEAQVCGLMQNIGRMMALYHLYPEIERSHTLQADKNITEDEAIRQTLGVGFDEVGAAIAAHWSLPDVLQKCIGIRKEKAPPRSVNTPLEWHQYAALYARAVTDILFRLPEGREKIEIVKETEYFRLVLRLKDVEVREWIEQSLLKTDQLLGELGVPCDVAHARILLRKASERVHDVLSAQDSLAQESKHMEGRKPIEVFQQVLRQLHDKYDFSRSLLCLPDGSSGLVAVAGVGRNAGPIALRFRCQGAKADIFRLIFNKKADHYIADTQAENYAKYMPEWYAALVGARSVMLLTLVVDDQPVGLIYGDFDESHPKAPFDGASDPAVREWRELLQEVLRVHGAKG